MANDVKAIIDIGSNSIKLRVGRRTENGDIEELLDRSEIVQIGKGFVNGGISEERMRKAMDVVTNMVAAARERGSDTSDFSELHGMTLSQDNLKGQIQLYATLTLEERQNIIGLPPLRANVISGSACIVFCALRALDVYSCTISLNGLRHAILKELPAKGKKTSDMA